MPFEAYSRGLADLTDEEQFDLMTLLVQSIKTRAKQRRNAEYLAMLDKSLAQLDAGDVVVKSIDELNAMAAE